MGSLLDNFLGSLLNSLLLFLLYDVVECLLVFVVNKMVARSIGAESNSVEHVTQFSFVLGMAIQVSQFMFTMSKLTLTPTLVMSTLLKQPAHFSLVTARIDAGVFDGGAVGAS